MHRELLVGRHQDSKHCYFLLMARPLKVPQRANARARWQVKPNQAKQPSSLADDFGQNQRHSVASHSTCKALHSGEASPCRAGSSHSHIPGKPSLKFGHGAVEGSQLTSQRLWNSCRSVLMSCPVQIPHKGHIPIKRRNTAWLAATRCEAEWANKIEKQFPDVPNTHHFSFDFSLLFLQAKEPFLSIL